MTLSDGLTSNSVTFPWLVWTVDNISVTSPGNQTTAIDTQVSLQIDAASSAGVPLSYSADGLPPGLSIHSSTGLISGSTDSGGRYGVQVTATDGSGGTGSVAFMWGVAAVTVTNPPDQSTAWGTQVSLQIHASDRAGLPLTFSAADIPPGLSINSSTGLISGTPTQAEDWSPEVTVTDPYESNTVEFEWLVDRISVTSPGLQSTKLGTAVVLPIQASSTSGSSLPLSYAASNLPTGLSIGSSTGLIYGTATKAGDFAVTVTVSDGITSGSATFTWTVTAATTYTGTIRLVKLGYCLDDRGNSSSNGAAVQVRTCNGGASQVWQVMNDGTIRHKRLCLDATGDGTANGTKVRLRVCTGKPNQQWSTRNYRVKYTNPAARNKVLTDPGNGGNNTQQELWTNNGTKNQTWATS